MLGRVWTEALPGLAAAVGSMLVIDVGVTLALYLIGRRSSLVREVDRRCRRPAAVFAVLLGVELGTSGSALPSADRADVHHLTLLVLLGVGAWLAIEAVLALEDRWLRKYDIAAANNLLARKKRTQILVLNRVTVGVMGGITFAVMLMTFHEVRALGTSLLASAGLAGLVAGAAARPILGNVAAGIQIAFTDPIRLDDVVVVDGQWGRIEEITLSYVVMRLWDLRRLVLPISYFVENPFENWTRSSAQILGSALFHLDYAVPIDELRDAFQRILDSSPRWDGDVGVLQVTDTTERTVEVRALVSAPDSSTAFDLRCEVRERVVGWLQEHHPEALPRERTQLTVDEHQSRQRGP